MILSVFTLELQMNVNLPFITSNHPSVFYTCFITIKISIPSKQLKFLSFWKLFQVPSTHIFIKNHLKLAAIQPNMLGKLKWPRSCMKVPSLQDVSTSRLTFMNPCIKDTPLHWCQTVTLHACIHAPVGSICVCTDACTDGEESVWRSMRAAVLSALQTALCCWRVGAPTGLARGHQRLMRQPSHKRTRQTHEYWYGSGEGWRPGVSTHFNGRKWEGRREEGTQTLSEGLKMWTK